MADGDEGAAGPFWGPAADNGLVGGRAAGTPTGWGETPDERGSEEEEFTTGNDRTEDSAMINATATVATSTPCLLRAFIGAPTTAATSGGSGEVDALHNVYIFSPERCARSTEHGVEIR